MTPNHTVASEVAALIAANLPTPTALSVAPFDKENGPAADAVSVRAHYVGAMSADLVLVAGAATAEALAGAGVGVTPAEILRPALEAGVESLGPGMLDGALTEPLGTAFEDPDIDLFALEDSDGLTQAWFGLRVRTVQPTVAEPDVAAPSAPSPAATSPSAPSQAAPAAGGDATRSRMSVLHDVELVLTAEIGRTRLPMRQVLELVPGTVLELDRAAGSPADVMVNGRLVARGDVVVVDEEYGIRITEIISPEAGQ